MLDIVLSTDTYRSDHFDEDMAAEIVSLIEGYSRVQKMYRSGQTNELSDFSEEVLLLIDELNFDNLQVVIGRYEETGNLFVRFD